MQSPIKCFAVYDLETGGFKKEFNSITEAAIVIVSNETLEIIDEFSVMLRPRLDLRSMNESGKKEAKRLFKELAVKDPEDNIQKLSYKGEVLTPRTILTISEEIELFYNHLLERSNILGDKGFILEYEDYLELQETEFADMSKLFFDLCYNPQALAVTHMTIELLLKEGVSHEEGFELFYNFIKKHTVGLSKPVLTGHNIIKFDNPFTEKWFEDNGKDLYSVIVKDDIEDTLTLCRKRWFELSSFSLGVCANALGLTLKEAHRALPDTKANAEVLIALYKNLRGEGQGEVEYTRKKYNFNF